MNINYFTIYDFFSRKPIIWIRIFILFFFPVLFFFGEPVVFKKLLGVYSIFIISELFLDVLSRFAPSHTVLDSDKNFVESLTYKTRKIFKNEKTSFQISKKIMQDREAKFFLEKLGVPLSLSQIQIPKEELLQQAGELVVRMRGKHIFPIDLFVSYILLIEESTHFLKEHGLTNDDILTINYWVHHAFHIEEKKSRFQFLGTGVFDSLVYGWNYELKKYAQDLSHKILSRFIPPSIVGREEEYEKLILALSKQASNNVIIVGDAGVGKTTIVEHFAWESHNGFVPGNISNMKIFELFADRLLAGIQNAGQLEERLDLLLSDMSHAGNVICFIQNIEIIFGGGGMNFDLSGVLYEYLKNGNIQVIGTATRASFNKFIENKESIVNLFEFIHIEEPDAGGTLLMLIEKAALFETQYSISINYLALKEIIILSSSYFPEKVLPGKAILVLDEAANFVHLQKKHILEKEDIVKLIEKKTHIVLDDPTPSEKKILLHLEDALHKRVVGQQKAIESVAGAMRRLRSGFVNEKRPISTFLFLGPTGVGKTETAKALAEVYFGNAENFIRLDMSEFQTQDQIERLLGEEPGEEYVSNTLAEKVLANPFSLILLDEFEKAHSRLLDIFLQVFDEGRFTDNKGVTVSFTNTIIIATSNAGSEFIREELERGAGANDIQNKLVEVLLSKHNFKPELINRFDGVVIFTPLNEEEIKKIANLILSEVFKKLEDQQIFVKFDESVLLKIIQEGYSKEFGARYVRRYIQDTIEDFLSKQILSDIIKKGQEVMLGVENGQLTLKQI